MAGLRQAWPDPDPESALALDVIQETLAINQLFLTNHNWESNERRAQLNRRNFLRHWNEARTGGSAQRVMFKFGASHMIRGLRPLRPLFSAARTKKSDPELMRIVHGFDAILVLTGSRPSQMM